MAWTPNDKEVEVFANRIVRLSTPQPAPHAAEHVAELTARTTAGWSPLERKRKAIAAELIRRRLMRRFSSTS
jgi:hypothetical protein